jgi:hypothetical protein
MNGPNKLELLFILGKALFPSLKWHYSLMGLFVSCKETEVYWKLLQGLYSLISSNRPNKLKCYIKLSQKGLPVTNTLAF